MHLEHLIKALFWLHFKVDKDNLVMHFLTKGGNHERYSSLQIKGEFPIFWPEISFHVKKCTNSAKFDIWWHTLLSNKKDTSKNSCKDSKVALDTMNQTKTDVFLRTC